MYGQVMSIELTARASREYWYTTTVGFNWYMSSRPTEPETAMHTSHNSMISGVRCTWTSAVSPLAARSSFAFRPCFSLNAAIRNRVFGRLAEIFFAASSINGKFAETS